VASIRKNIYLSDETIITTSDLQVTEEKRTNVYISASFRSGSSFLGSIFDQNSDFLYYFEPLTGSKSDREEILKEAFTCKLPRNRKDNLQETFHLKATVGHWHGSETLCSPPFCSEGKMWCGNKCEDPFSSEKGEQMLIDFCKRKKGVAVKEFRLDEPEQLYKLVEDENVDLKIIRLIRDPRSMLVSRRKMGKAYALQAKVEQIFRDCEKNLDFYIDSKIHDSILFVRYEDIARAPKNFTFKIYDHLKIEINTELLKKFDEATHADSEKEKSTFTVNKGKTEEEIFDGWKNKVPDLVSKEEIKEIENRCKLMMKLFGYRRDVFGKTNVSSVDPDWILSVYP